MRKYAPPTENYFRMYNKVFDLNLKATTFLLYSYLLCCAGSKGYCWPSLETISRKTRLSISAIQDHLKILEKRHLIRKSKHGAPGGIRIMCTSCWIWRTRKFTVTSQNRRNYPLVKPCVKMKHTPERSL